MKDKDSKLLWESYVTPVDEGSNSHGYNQGKGAHWDEYRKELAASNPDLAYERAKTKRAMGLRLTDEDLKVLAFYSPETENGSSGTEMKTEEHDGDHDSEVDYDDNFSNKFRGPGAPGVNLAKGFLLQALELINDRDVHLCADAGALKTTIGALDSAIQALSHDKHEVPGVTEDNIEETKSAPPGHYFTKSGNLVKGTLGKDERERGATKSDPKDKQRSKIPPVTQVREKKDDRCKNKADQVYGSKTSAYKSGAIVRCRQGKIWKKK